MGTGRTDTSRVSAFRPCHVLHGPAYRRPAEPAGHGRAAGAPRGRHQPEGPGKSGSGPLRSRGVVGGRERPPGPPAPQAYRAVLSWLRSTRAAPWTWPVRSPSACPACSASWTSEQMSMRLTSMVGAFPGESRPPREGEPEPPRMVARPDDTAQPGPQVPFADLQRLSGSDAAVGPTPAP